MFFLKGQTYINKVILFFVFSLLAGFSSAAHADYQTNLAYQGYVQDGSGDIDVDFYSVPVVYDWNSDGKKDLLIGQKYREAPGVVHGYVTYYENMGSNDSPSFGTGSLIEACTSSCYLLDVTADG